MRQFDTAGSWRLAHHQPAFQGREEEKFLLQTPPQLYTGWHHCLNGVAPAVEPEALPVAPLSAASYVAGLAAAFAGEQEK